MKRRMSPFAPLIIAAFFELVFFNLGYWMSFFNGGSIPFELILPRFFLAAAVCYAVYAFRPSSRLHEMALMATKCQVAIICAVVALHAISFFIIPLHYAGSGKFESGFTKYEEAVYDDGQQYAYLADALIEGHAYLNLEVPDYLREMENPYDANRRLELAREFGQPTYWDYAYYKGHYYCYFGVLPALVMFMPFKLLTGNDLPTYYAVGASAVLLCISIAVFLFVFFRRYYPRSSLGSYLLMFMLFAMGSGVLVQVFYPLFYSLPPLWSLFLLFFGLSAWIHAKGDGRLRPGFLFLGSCCMGLILCCRPQMFLGVLLAFPLFWNEIVKDRLFFSRKGLGNTIAVIAPCLVIGLAVMFYNYVRFDSPFEFGAIYNLTGFDMTAKEPLGLRALVIALAFYVCMPLKLQGSFPYITVHGWDPVAVEPFYGGFFAFNPAALAVFGLPAFRRDLKERGLWGLSITCCVLALPLMALSTQMASVSMRYMTDFCFAILIPAMCVLLSCLDRAKNGKWWKWAIAALVACVVAGELLGFYSLLGVERYGSLAVANPDIYALFERWFSVFP